VCSFSESLKCSPQSFFLGNEGNKFEEIPWEYSKAGNKTKAGDPSLKLETGDRADTIQRYCSIADRR
jgi:hypothetical protein